jgi:type II secretory ATPase GspE/PulE/Tfp pilus assembly ATPase PilB-like protein
VADDTLKRALVRRAPVDEIRELAVEQGMRTLLQDGIEKARAGLTDLKQVLAVCSQ